VEREPVVRRYAALVIRLRWLLLVAIGGLLVASAIAVPRLDLDFSVFSLLEASDEAKAEIDEFYSYLPPRPVDAVCVLEWDEPIKRSELEEIRTLTFALRELPGVASVRSLADAYIIESSFGIPLPKALLSAELSGPVIERVEDHPLLLGRLISRDGRAAALVLERAGGGRGWLDEVEAKIDELEPDGVREVRILAPDRAESILAGHMVHDLLQSLVLLSICFLILMPVLFRTLRATFLPLAVVACAVLFHLASTVAIGASLSLIEVAIPGLITIIAFCDAIHMLHRFEESRAEGHGRRTAILEMMAKVGRASFLTSLTTILGLLSLRVVDHDAVRDFAVSAAAGVLIAFLCVITLLPLLLSIVPVGGSSGGMRSFVRIAYGSRRLTYAAFLLAGLVSVFGVSRLTIGSRWLDEFPPDEPLVEDLQWYQEEFTGYLSLDVKLQGELDTIDAFRAVEALERRILQEPDVRSAESYTDWVREWLGTPPGERLAGARIVGGLYYLKLSSAAFAFPVHAVTRDFRLGRIRFQVEDGGTNRFLELIELVEEEAKDLPEGLTAEVAGLDAMARESSRMIIVTMLKSIGLSMATISLFLALIYRSGRLGLLAAVVNGAPILVALGLSGLLAIPIRTGTVMLFALGVGLAVDNTIHLVTRFIQERRADPGATIRDHLQRSLNTTGTALVASSAALILGALCYLPSSFQTMKDVGVILPAMVLTALLAEIFLLPHLLERFGGPRIGTAALRRPRREMAGPETDATSLASQRAEA